jgi:hypothetical protein
LGGQYSPLAVVARGSRQALVVMYERWPFFAVVQALVVMYERWPFFAVVQAVIGWTGHSHLFMPQEWINR